ncbi:MAG: type II secretion system F family protein [Hyphomonas sp.]|nr:type II secretion system F family protein [Hyphomonas sp.]MCB9971566.1 type II secretion system F family protein [Hyphomonas sp.]
MPAFEYVAIDPEGQRQRGTISADSQRLARRELRLRDLLAVELKEVQGGVRKKFSLRGHVTSAQRVQTVRQIAALLQSGLPVEQVLVAAASQSPKHVQLALLAVLSQVREGRRLSTAMNEATGLFTPLTRAVVSAGERSGRLGDVMDELAGQLERSYQIEQKVKAALVYPAFLGIMALAMIVALLTIIVPRLVEQFDVYGSQLPALTRGVIAVSNALIHAWPIWVALVIGLAVLAIRLPRMTALQARLDSLVLGAPVIGRLKRTIAAARFARVFAILSSSGATVLEALQGGGRAAGSHAFNQASEEIAERVRSGGSFAAALQRTGVFPPLMAHMVLSGEAGRNIPAMMNRSAAYLETEFDTRTATLMSLIEPAIILVLGGIVGTVVLAIMLPILQINTFAFQ